MFLKEAVILAASEPWAINGTVIDKAMLKLNTLTLLDFQIKWLIDHGITHIVVASDKQYDILTTFREYVEYSLETFPLGTSGAILAACDLIEDKRFYVLNLDDVVLGWNPQLMASDNSLAKILVSKPRLPFGLVDVRRGEVLRFREKPIVDAYANVGHYLFHKAIVSRFFKDIGSLEEDVLPELARMNILRAEKLTGTWIPLETVKSYYYLRETLASLKL